MRANGQKLVSATMHPDSHTLLKKYAYGNVSRLIELLIQAYAQGRMLTEKEVIRGELDDDDDEENSKAA